MASWQFYCLLRWASVIAFLVLLAIILLWLCCKMHLLMLMLSLSSIHKLSDIIKHSDMVKLLLPHISFLCVHLDHQAIRHCHCTNTWSPPPPHHADHGLRAAALPEAGQHSEDWPREELQHAVLAGIPKTHDSWKLPGEPAGTLPNISFIQLRLR